MKAIFEKVFLEHLTRDMMGSKFSQKLHRKSKSGSLDPLSALAKGPKKPPVPFHQRPRRQLGWTDPNRDSQQLIAQVHKDDAMELPILKLMKSKESGIMPVTQPNILNSIIDLFNLTGLDHETPKTLGNTGITLAFSPNHNAYCLNK